MFQNEKQFFYINEIARLINEDPSNTHKKLLELKKEGVLIDKFQGKERFFQLNVKFKFFKEYQRIIFAENSALGLIREFFYMLKKEKKVAFAFAFGNSARNRLSKGEVELLIVGSIEKLVLDEKIKELSKQTKRELSFILLTEKSFQVKRAKKDPLLESIFKKPIFKLVGSFNLTKPGQNNPKELSSFEKNRLKVIHKRG